MISLLQIDVSGTILTDLAKFSPVMAIMALLIYGLNKKLENKEEEVKSLNQAFRESERENIKLLSDLSLTLDKITDAGRYNTDNIVREIQTAKEQITMLINHKIG